MTPRALEHRRACMADISTHRAVHLHVRPSPPPLRAPATRRLSCSTPHIDIPIHYSGSARGAASPASVGTLRACGSFRTSRCEFSDLCAAKLPQALGLRHSCSCCDPAELRGALCRSLPHWHAQPHCTRAAHIFLQHDLDRDAVIYRRHVPCPTRGHGTHIAGSHGHVIKLKHLWSSSASVL